MYKAYGKRDGKWYSNFYDKIPQYYRCQACIYNLDGVCQQSPTLDKVEEYLAECDEYSNCGKNRRK